MPELVQCFAFGDLPQQLPQMVAIVQLRKLALPGPPKERLAGADNNVLLVGHSSRRPLELTAGQPDKPCMEMVPNVGRRLAIISLDVF